MKELWKRNNGIWCPLIGSFIHIGCKQFSEKAIFPLVKKIITENIILDIHSILFELNNANDISSCSSFSSFLKTSIYSKMNYYQILKNIHI